MCICIFMYIYTYICIFVDVALDAVPEQALGVMRCAVDGAVQSKNWGWQLFQEHRLPSPATQPGATLGAVLR